MIDITGINYRLTGKSDDPTELDYNIFGFNKIKKIVKGELIEVLLVDQEENPVVKETRTYTRGALDMLQTRVLHIEWYLTNGEIGCSQTSKVKTYTPEEALVEGEVRRKNVITEAKYQMMTLVGLNNAKIFLQEVKSEMDLYIEGQTSNLITAVNNSTDSFMTSEIKTTITELLTL